MKAVVITRYGPPADVLRLTDIATPEPGADELLIKVYASSVNPVDDLAIKGPLFFLPTIGRLLKPKRTVAGVDFAGRVESTGRSVTRFRAGDEVFGAWFKGKSMGAFAEYMCVPEESLAPKPLNLSFEEAAAVPVAALTALQGLRDHGRIQAGQKVLIEGASGGVGSFAVQLAKSFGAEVTAVCSARNVDAARAIGADHVIDYAREDFTKGGFRYDLIFGANAHHSIFAYRRVSCRGGVTVVAGGSLAMIFQAMVLGPLFSRIGEKKVRFFIAKMSGRDLLALKDLVEAGDVAPVIDRRYPLSEVADAVAYREEGHARGKVVITIREAG